MLGYGSLTLLVMCATRQVGHKPMLNGPDPAQVYVFFPGDNLGMLLWLSTMAAHPLSWLCAGVILFHSLAFLAKARLAIDARSARHLAFQIGLCALGLALFMDKFRSTAYWLFD